VLEEGRRVYGEEKVFGFVNKDTTTFDFFKQKNEGEKGAS
jgi:hypothetical protein